MLVNLILDILNLRCLFYNQMDSLNEVCRFGGRGREQVREGSGFEIDIFRLFVCVQMTYLFIITGKRESGGLGKGLLQGHKASEGPNGEMRTDK